jgi:hypothetical protein
MEAGMTTVRLQKPLDVESLDRAVAALLSQVPRRRVLNELGERIAAMEPLLGAGDDAAIESAFHDMAVFARRFTLRDVESLALEGERLLARGASDRLPLRDIVRAMVRVHGWIAA